MACRLIALYVTVEQEIAIRKLFNDKGWTYQSEDLPVDLGKQPSSINATCTKSESHLQAVPTTTTTVNYFEVQVVHGVADSDNETTDYDGEALLSELIDTSQSIENNSDNVKVEMMPDAGAFVIGNEIVHDNESSRTNTVTDAERNMYMVADGTDTQVVSDAVMALDHTHAEYSMTENDQTKTHYTNIEDMRTRNNTYINTDNKVHFNNKSTQFNNNERITENIKHFNDRNSKTELKRFDDDLDMEQKVKLCTIEEFDDLKPGPFVETSIGTPKDKQSSKKNTDMLVGKRGRPRKKLEIKEAGNDKTKGESNKVFEEKIKIEEDSDKPEKVGKEKVKGETIKKECQVSKNTATVKESKRNKKGQFVSKKKRKVDHKINKTKVLDSDDDSEEENEKVNKRSDSTKSEVPSMEEFKKMLEVWTKAVEEDPQKEFSKVHYGYFLKPIDQPTDLNADFYSEVCGGWFCSNCSLLFKNKVKFIKHRMKTDGKCFYECDICQQRYMVRSEMTNHRKYHTKDRPFACQFCNGRYSRRHTLNNHIQQNHQHQNPYMCYICGKLFKIRPCLLRHLKYAHIDDRDALCSQCPKRFKSVHDLKAHARTHLTEKEWPCDICNKPFKTRKYMREHRKIHSQERVQICEVCGKGFYKREHLKNHMLLHTGAKPYACSVCSYRCTVKCNLVKHTKTHLRNADSLTRFKNDPEFKNSTEYKSEADY